MNKRGKSGLELSDISYKCSKPVSVQWIKIHSHTSKTKITLRKLTHPGVLKTSLNTRIDNLFRPLNSQEWRKISISYREIQKNNSKVKLIKIMLKKQRMTKAEFMRKRRSLIQKHSLVNPNSSTIAKASRQLSIKTSQCRTLQFTI